MLDYLLRNAFIIQITQKIYSNKFLFHVFPNLDIQSFILNNICIGDCVEDYLVNITVLISSSPTHTNDLN